MSRHWLATSKKTSDAAIKTTLAPYAPGKGVDGGRNGAGHQRQMINVRKLACEVGKFSKG